MNLSRPGFPPRPGLGNDRGVHEEPEARRQIEASIQAILHLRQIAVGVLGEVERMVGASATAVLRFPRIVFTQRKSACWTAARPEKAMMNLQQHRQGQSIFSASSGSAPYFIPSDASTGFSSVATRRFPSGSAKRAIPGDPPMPPPPPTADYGGGAADETPA
jgi:hypothetical protein